MAQPRLGVTGGHQAFQEPRCPAPCTSCSGSPRQWPVPARSPHPSTYQQPLAALISHPWRLERGAGCPPWGPSPAHSPSRWLLHQHRCASIHRQSKLGRGERDIKGDVTGGVGTSPPRASPSLQEPRGCARLVAPPYLPAGHMGAGLVEDAGPRAGCAGGGFSSCWLPAPPASPNPRHPQEQQLPGVSQEAVKDLPSVDRRPCGQLAADLPAGGRRGPRAGTGVPQTLPQ